MPVSLLRPRRGASMMASTGMVNLPSLPMALAGTLVYAVLASIKVSTRQTVCAHGPWATSTFRLLCCC